MKCSIFQNSPFLVLLNNGFDKIPGKVETNHGIRSIILLAHDPRHTSLESHGHLGSPTNIR